MKITGGLFQGMVLAVPAGAEITRPTSDKVRQALFNILRGRIEDGSFLDLYAGTGSVGLEALSRGFGSVVLVEKNPRAFRCLGVNCQRLLERGAESGRLDWIWQDARTYCQEAMGRGQRFSAVFADPPFAQDFTGLWERLQPLLTEGGAGIVQFPSRRPPDFTQKASRVYAYGESSLAVFLV